MKKIVILFVFAFLLVGCTQVAVEPEIVSNCLAGSGNVTDQTLGMGEFSSINLAVPGNVYITQGDRTRLKVEMENNIFEDLEIDVSNGLLTISNGEYECYDNNEPINFYLTMKDIRALTITGSGNIAGETKIVSNDLYLKIIGSGKIEIDVNAKNLGSAIEGSGKIVLIGDAVNFDTAIIGSGAVDADNLVSNTAKINIEGSGSADVYAKNLEIDIDGSGIVRYKGEPDTLSHNIEGSGSIVKK